MDIFLINVLKFEKVLFIGGSCNGTEVMSGIDGQHLSSPILCGHGARHNAKQDWNNKKSSKHDYFPFEMSAATAKSVGRVAVLKLLNLTILGRPHALGEQTTRADGRRFPKSTPH
jgi:hypothetical protein